MRACISPFLTAWIAHGKTRKRMRGGTESARRRCARIGGTNQIRARGDNSGRKGVLTMEIKMQNYELSMSKAATVAAAMDKMPIYQTVRGAKQWSAVKREQLV